MKFTESTKFSSFRVLIKFLSCPLPHFPEKFTFPKKNILKFYFPNNVLLITLNSHILDFYRIYAIPSTHFLAPRFLTSHLSNGNTGKVCHSH